VVCLLAAPRASSSLACAMDGHGINRSHQLATNSEIVKRFLSDSCKHRCKSCNNYLAFTWHGALVVSMGCRNYDQIVMGLISGRDTLSGYYLDR